MSNLTRLKEVHVIQFTVKQGQQSLYWEYMKKLMVGLDATCNFSGTHIFTTLEIRILCTAVELSYILNHIEDEIKVSKFKTYKEEYIHETN